MLLMQPTFFICYLQLAVERTLLEEFYEVVLQRMLGESSLNYIFCCFREISVIRLSNALPKLSNFWIGKHFLNRNLSIETH